MPTTGLAGTEISCGLTPTRLNRERSTPVRTTAERDASTESPSLRRSRSFTNRVTFCARAQADSAAASRRASKAYSHFSGGIAWPA